MTWTTWTGGDPTACTTTLGEWAAIMPITRSTTMTWGEWGGEWRMVQPNTGLTWQEPHRYPLPVETAAEIAAREEKARQEAARKARAEQQAENLLLELLTPEQRAGYRDAKKFHVIAQSGKRYEVDCRKRMHNVFEVNPAGKRVEEHCIYQRGDLPLPDNIAAQVLLLTADEEEFRRIANQRRVG
jgi:hypothetical protein